jgi:glycerol uptake facilitator-like aquaporin
VCIEIITTFMLVVTFFMNFVDKSQPCHGNLAPIPIGFAVIVGILASGNLSGGSMNPARSLGPAVAANFYQDQWVYWVSPSPACPTLLVRLFQSVSELLVPVF